MLVSLKSHLKLESKAGELWCKMVRKKLISYFLSHKLKDCSVLLAVIEKSKYLSGVSNITLLIEASLMHLVEIIVMVVIVTGNGKLKTI